MRSVDVMRRTSLLALAAPLLLAGCANFDLFGSKRPELPTAAVQQMPVPKLDAAADKPAAVVAAAEAPPPKPAEPPLPPIDANTQRAFDDAVRAMRGGRGDDAERQLKSLAQAQPQLAGVHANLALIHRRAGRDAEAVSALEQAVKLSPKQATYRNQLGISYRQAGQFRKAMEAYESAIELDAGYAAPQLNLAILLDLYLGDRSRAAEWYQRSAVLLPGDAPQINKWLADLKNRKPEAAVAGGPSVAQVAASSQVQPQPRKEKE